MSQQDSIIDAPWAAHLQPWVSALDATEPQPVGEVFDFRANPPAHPISTNADHTGLRSSLDQFRLPRPNPSVSAA